MLGLVEIAIIAFFVLLTLVIIIGYTLPRWRQHESQYGSKPSRVLKRDEWGNLVVIGDREVDAPVQFEGTGTWSSKPVALAAGSYRIAYRFPVDVLVRVGLVSSLDGEDVTLLIKSGSGVEGFDLEGAAYIVQVQPADERAHWRIDLQRVKRLRQEEFEAH